MNLTLEVISANGSSMGGARRKVFSEAGGSIGRAADCDWVLPSPDKYVSRHHASVLFKYGQFYVKAEGENSVAVNDPNTPLSSDTPSPLKQGDRVYIDEYEILVSLPREVARPPLIVGDPFADEPGEEALIPAGGTLSDENLDPLSQLLGGSSRPSSSEPKFRGPPAGDVLSDPFIPTPIQTPRVTPPLIPRDALMPSSRDESPIPSGGGTGTGTVIPTDPDAWNKTTYGLNSIQSKPVAAPPVSAPPREAVRQAAPAASAQSARPAVAARREPAGRRACAATRAAADAGAAAACTAHRRAGTQFRAIACTCAASGARSGRRCRAARCRVRRGRDAGGRRCRPAKRFPGNGCNLGTDPHGRGPGDDRCAACAR